MIGEDERRELAETNTDRTAGCLRAAGPAAIQ
jgi:hypothetical protein